MSKSNEYTTAKALAAH